MKYFHFINTTDNKEYVVAATTCDAARRLAEWALKSPALNGEVSFKEADALGCPIISIMNF